MWFFKKKKDTQQEELIKKIKAENLDLNGLFSNINNRDKVALLYRELCLLSHPDKNPTKYEQAQKLFNKVQECRNDYNALLQLKDEIINSLTNN